MNGCRDDALAGERLVTLSRGTAILKHREVGKWMNERTNKLSGVAQGERRVFLSQGHYTPSERGRARESFQKLIGDRFEHVGVEAPDQFDGASAKGFAQNDLV